LFSQNKKVFFQDWGLIPYEQAWEKQKRLLEKTAQIKLANRKTQNQEEQIPTPNYLAFCEHPHVYTLGKNGKAQHLLLSQEQLSEKGIAYYPIDRGGDITYHGPGQIVGYPILDLENFFTDIHRYLRTIEEAIIRTLKVYNIEAGVIPGLTGVWLGIGKNPRKIAAIGVKCSRWITMHGFAFNINVDLSYFNYIIPCGISDKSVTSLTQELGYPVPLEEIKPLLLSNLAQAFGWELQQEVGEI
jgi:lipoyl(octanoyl) transferase